MKFCKSCSINKNLSEFYIANKRGGDGYQYECKKCTRERMKTVVRDPVKSKETARAYRMKPEIRLRLNAGMRATRQKQKIELLNAYSENNPKCVCCGEKNMEFLCLDHIAGGGNKQRARLGGTVGVRKYLRENNYPPGFQVLCHNCNSSIGSFGYCPHKKI